MKILSIPLLLCLLVVCTTADICTFNGTWAATVAPGSDTIKVLSVSSLYDNFEVVWDESLTDNVEVAVRICTDSSDDYNSFLFSLDNEDGSVVLKLNKTIPVTPNTTTATSTTGNADKGVYTSAAVRIAPSLLSFSAVVLFFFAPKRFSIALLVLAAVLLMSSNGVSANVSAATKVTLRVAAPLTINKFCTRDQCFLRNSNGAVANYISFFGKRYASLDAVYGNVCNASTKMEVPTGWALATGTDDVFRVIQLGNWNAWSVIIADGTAYSVGQYKIVNTYGDLRSFPDYFGAGKNGYSVSNCDSRILITQDFPVVEASKQLVGAPRITNFITFHGYDYAVADNTPYYETNIQCQSKSIYIDADSEWSLAPNDDASHIVRHSGSTATFGTNCIVFADGSSYTADLTPCAAGALSTLPYGNGNIYSVGSCNNFYARIFIRRVSTKVDSWASQVGATNTFFSSGISFATIDNIPPQQTDAPSCQSRFMTPPTGWRVATAGELAQLISATGFGAWATSYCMAANGLSLDHTNVSCAASLVTKTVNGVNYYQTKTCGRVLTVQSMDKKTDFSIGMKILVISVYNDVVADVALQLAITMFNATGAGYEHINLLDTSNGRNYPSDLPLYDSTGNPKYYAIILTDSQLSYTVGTTSQSALSTDQKAQLTIYKYLFSVRLVALSGYPDSTKGFVAAGGSIAPAGSYMRLDATFVTSYANVLGGLKTDKAFDISGIYTVSATLPSGGTPILRYTSSATEAPAAQAIGAAIVKLVDGTEEMHFFLGNSINVQHGPILASMWLNWVTKGAWVGSRRVYLVPQVDDLLMTTESFDNPAVVNRMTGNDLRKTKTFLQNMKAPAGSKIGVEFGFNGASTITKPGTNDFDDELYNTIREMREDFWWESHTFTHLDLTCPESNCATYGTTSYDSANFEVSKNIEFTVNSLFKEYGGLDQPNFSRYCMITPKITGLFNVNALKALADNGLQCVVGDNSVAALIPDNLYHGHITTVAENGYDGIFVIPRFPTEIYFDSATPATEVIEFNARYGIGGSIIPAAKNKTLDEILQQEGERTVRNLMFFRHDPYMFHQGNLIHFTYTKAGDAAPADWSLLTLWIQTVVDMYETLMSLPVLDTKHDDLYTLYKARMARDACGASATLTVSGGSATQVTVTSTGSCELAVTGLSSCGSASGCRVETYGPDTTVWATLSANSANLPLTTAWTNN